jgi:hypothetical protein
MAIQCGRLGGNENCRRCYGSGYLPDKKPTRAARPAGPPPRAPDSIYLQELIRAGQAKIKSPARTPDSIYLREAPQPKEVTRGVEKTGIPSQQVIVPRPKQVTRVGEKPPGQSLFKSGSRIVQGLPADIGGSSVPTRKRWRQPKSKRKPKSPTGKVSARPNVTPGARTESGAGKSRNDTSVFQSQASANRRWTGLATSVDTARTVVLVPTRDSTGWTMNQRPDLSLGLAEILKIGERAL